MFREKPSKENTYNESNSLHSSASHPSHNKCGKPLTEWARTIINHTYHYHYQSYCQQWAIKFMKPHYCSIYETFHNMWKRAPQLQI
jgi:hypothetical protein